MGTDHRRLMNEGPTVVGILTSVTESGGSLDEAVRTVAAEGPPLSRGIFGDAVRRADTKGSRGVKEALSEAVSGLDEDASGYRQAIMLCICASESPDGPERLAALREASDVALCAVRTIGERYAESLTVPCTAVFALGILLPMILVSMAPVMGIGWSGAPPMDGRAVDAVVLVAIPVAIAAVCLALRRGNPFAEDGPSFPRGALLLLAIVPLCAALIAIGIGPADAVPMAAVPICILSAVLLAAGEGRTRARGRAEHGLRDAVSEIGNLLTRGENFENVSVEALASRPECSAAAESLERELALCRGDVQSAISAALSPVSGEASRALRDIYRCSLDDADDAGALAVALGRQFQDSDRIRAGIGIRTRSMRDTMIGTAVLFAPMVLGLSVSMLAPLGDLAGRAVYEGAGDVVAVYLTELSALIAVLTSCLDGGGAGGAAWRFSVMAPVSLTVYRLCSAVQLLRCAGRSIMGGGPCASHGSQGEGAGGGRGRMHRAGAAGRSRAVHGAPGLVQAPGRYGGPHRRRVPRTRAGRRPVRPGRPPVPSAGGPQLRAERLPDARLHEGHGHSLRRGGRVRGGDPPPPESAGCPCGGPGIDAHRAHGRGVGRGDHGL